MSVNFEKPRCNIVSEKVKMMYQTIKSQKLHKKCIEKKPESLTSHPKQQNVQQYSMYSIVLTFFTGNYTSNTPSTEQQSALLFSLPNVCMYYRYQVSTDAFLNSKTTH